MLPAKGAGVAHRISGADARRNDQLSGKVGLLATAKTKPPQVTRAELCGDDVCDARGITVRSSSPVLAMCRALVESGHHPTMPLEAYRGETLCLRVRSIGEAANIEVNGNTRFTFVGVRKRRTAPPMRQNRRGVS